MKRQLLQLRGVRTLIAVCAALALVISICAVWCVADPLEEDPTSTPSIGDASDDSTSPADGDGGSSADGEDPSVPETSDETPSDESSSEETSSEEASSEETSSEASAPEEPTPAYKVTLQLDGSYEPEGKITITAAVQDLDDSLDITGFFFDVRYDTDAMTLTNKVGEDNIVDCVAKLPNDRWENLTKLGEVPGTLRVAVAASESLVPASAEPEGPEVISGSLVLTLRFDLAEDLPESAVLSVSDVIAMDGESVSRDGLGTVLTLTAAEDETSSEPNASSDPDESSEASVSSEADESSDASVSSGADESSEAPVSSGVDESSDASVSSQAPVSSEPSASSATSASSASSVTSSPETGDVGIVFPFLLGTGALLGLLTAIRLRRKADCDPTRK